MSLRVSSGTDRLFLSKDIEVDEEDYVDNPNYSLADRMTIFEVHFVNRVVPS